MPSVRPLRGLGCVVAILVWLAMPFRVAAVDPIIGTPIPDEPLGTSMDLPASGGISFDLDGDGVRELITLGEAADARGLTGVRAWWVDANGAATQSNEIHVRRAASVDELLTGRGAAGIDRDEMIAVRTSEPSRLFTARRGGEDVPLVAAIGTPSDAPVPCCLTIWQIVSAGGHAIELRQVADTRQLGQQLMPADFDGDGTDEIFVNEGPIDPGDGQTPLTMEASILRWNGERFTRRTLQIGSLAACCPAPRDVGDTDGFPGEEVIVVGSDTDGSAAMVRVSVRDGEPVVETADIGQVDTARVLDLAQGPGIVTSDGFSGMYLWSWARDQQPVQEATRITGGAPLAVFGTGERTRLMIGTPGSVASILVLPGDLGGGAGPSVIFGRDLRAGAFAGGELGTQPLFSGLVPDGLPGMPDAFYYSGTIVQPVADPDALADSTPGPLLIGVQPLGRVGPDGSWEALLGNYTDQGFFQPFVPLYVDLQMVAAAGQLRLVGVGDLTSIEVNGGNLEPTFYGAAPDPETSRYGLIVGDEAVVAEIHGPPGTTVNWQSRGTGGDDVIGPSGSIQLQLLEPAGPDAPNGSGATAQIWAVTPGGHAYSGTWRIRVFREPPDLSVAAPDGVIQLNQTISGRTDPGVAVTVNGAPAFVDARGSFSAPVTAGILPTEFRVVATDPVGNVSVRVVTLVWPLDYRKLPFVPLAVVITIIAGAFLYLRKPDTGPRRQAPDDDATFEEIGG